MGAKTEGLHVMRARLFDGQGVVATPCRTGLTLRSLEGGETLAVNGALPRLLLYCSLSVEDANTEPRGLIITSAPTLIYGGRGMDGRSYI